MPVGRDELLCVHLKAKAVSILLCKDTKAQLSPEIRAAVNIKSLDGYGECSGAVARFGCFLNLKLLVDTVYIFIYLCTYRTWVPALLPGLAVPGSPGCAL